MNQLVELDANGDPDFMTSLARGLHVLRCFANARGPVTLAEVSQQAGLSRPAVRRCLHTLVRLGYAAREGQAYVLRPKVLALGHAYLASTSLAERAQPILNALCDQIGESCSLGVLEEDRVYYVARAETQRIMSMALRVGSQLPLYCTSMGRVLLAGLPEEELDAYLDRTELVASTPRTVTDRTELRRLITKAREEGFAVVDQELEIGLRSIAVPLRSGGRTRAAINVGVQPARVSMAVLRSRVLPALKKAVQELGSVAPPETLHAR
ncbi:IclR family transcriptional regulator C-terminal domain-containing protein [Sphingomonas arantia]|uniref:IclR family transcriptional regulator C-terminal domain-containing protein n=1 Tax=Sphingomonas arantia TaxID=1460676 RepID=A0ABW4TY09_9SPHN